MNPPILSPEICRWRKWWSLVLDLLYPPACAVCQVSLSDGRALCDRCDADLPRLAQPFCEKCGEAFPGKIDDLFNCPNCHNRKFAFEFARPATVRDSRTLDLIHRLKYNRELHLAKDLGRIATEAFSDPRLAVALAERWPLVAVPLHRQRYQKRHFNQAEEIARVVSHQTGLPVLLGLKRIRSTGHQTALTRWERLENLRGAFATTQAAVSYAENASEGVVLIDDVLTTGSTVDECAKVLHRAGFRRIVVVTVMRG